MRYIDAFCHFFPKALWDKLETMDGAAKDIGKRMRGVPAIFDLDERKRVCDMFREKHNYTLEEVGRVMQLTRERIRQIESKALKKLQHPLKSKKLREFLS